MGDPNRFTLVRVIDVERTCESCVGTGASPRSRGAWYTDCWPCAGRGRVTRYITRRPFKGISARRTDSAPKRSDATKEKA